MDQAGGAPRLQAVLERRGLGTLSNQKGAQTRWSVDSLPEKRYNVVIPRVQSRKQICEGMVKFKAGPTPIWKIISGVESSAQRNMGKFVDHTSWRFGDEDLGSFSQ